jgi:hypothetical protein
MATSAILRSYFTKPCAKNQVLFSTPVVQCDNIVNETSTFSLESGSKKKCTGAPLPILNFEGLAVEFGAVG